MRPDIAWAAITLALAALAALSALRVAGPRKPSFEWEPYLRLFLGKRTTDGSRSISYAPGAACRPCAFLFAKGFV